MVDAYQDVAFFYEKDLIPWEELAAMLSDMQLIIMSVTTNLLTKENRAVDEILPYAMKQHISVLPVMFESGLDESFRRVFQDLQYLKPGEDDPTAVPFERKLEKYLEGMLVGSELAQRVRDAFDAYIFLSYRKKDRTYAWELMRMIHSNPRYRDIAIWYDEYLVPGENFNENIRSALEKGDLFAMVVTPNLLEEGNYVMRHEYPVAKDSGKPILPAQMKETDRKELKQHFDNIPDSVNVHDSEAWNEAMTKYFQGLAIMENEEDPWHNFLIGLAYLDGIDVEVDSRRADELITGAAEDGLTEAMRKLVSMYHDGKGVERDYRKSADWQEKLVDALRKAWQENRNAEELHLYFSALWDLGDAWMALGDLGKAGEVYSEMLAAAEEEVKAELPDGMRDLSVSYGNLGDIERAMGRPEEAKTYYEKGLGISQQLVVETKMIKARRDLSISYERLGDIEQVMGRPEEAKAYYEKSLEISLQLAEEMKTVEARRDLSVSYNNIGDIEKEMGRPEEAKAYYEKGLKIFLQLTQETKTVEAWRDLSVSYNNLGDIERATGQPEEARAYYEESLEIRLQLAEETKTIQARRDLSISYERLGDIEQVMGRPEEAKAYYKKSQEIRLQLAEETKTVESFDDHAVSYFKIGTLGDEIDREYLLKAYQIWERLAQLYPSVRKVAERRDIVKKLLENS